MGFILQMLYKTFIGLRENVNNMEEAAKNNAWTVWMCAWMYDNIHASMYVCMYKYTHLSFGPDRGWERL